MNTNNSRFREAFNYLRFSNKTKDVTSFAKELGKNRSYISQILNDKVAVKDELLMVLQYKFGCFNIEWLLEGKGEMLEYTTEKRLVSKNTPSPTHITQNNVNGDNNVGTVISTNNGNCIPTQNKYGDSPSEDTADDKKWAPVVQASLAKRANYDIFGHIEKQLCGNMEKLYSGTANIDIWHYIEDNDLYPHYQKGDCLGLKAYERGDHRIKTGDVYVVDTKRDGLITRRFRIDDNGDFISYTFDDNDPQEFVIPQSDVIRVYKKVLMFRY